MREGFVIKWPALVYFVLNKRFLAKKIHTTQKLLYIDGIVTGKKVITITQH